MKAIPEPSMRRLVLLERLLSEFTEKNITSQKIQELTGWSAAVVRRDISLLELNFGASNGYKVGELKDALGHLLDLQPVRPHACCIVGLGRMGQALLDNRELYESPFKIVAGFDSSVNRTEILRSIFPLHPTTMLEQVIKEENIRYAILTVEPSEAHSIASRLAACGIKGIVNYTPCVLTVPPGTKVENVSLLTSLENLSAMSADENIERKEKGA
ncbi:MAG: redox-sensing transcriptional repressor Rex [Treponema sp.]|nr:redox-sensing transcriptional repressor Rex [Treponema sp.]